MKEQSKHKIEARFGLSMPKTPITTFCLTMLMGEFFLILFGSNFEFSFPTSREDNCRVPGSSHNRPQLHYYKHKELKIESCALYV